MSLLLYALTGSLGPDAIFPHGLCWVTQPPVVPEQDHILPRGQDVLLASLECGGFWNPENGSQHVEQELHNLPAKLLLCLSNP